MKNKEKERKEKEEEEFQRYLVEKYPILKREKEFLNTGRKKGPLFTYKYNRALDFWKDKEKPTAEPEDEKKCVFSFWKEREALGDQKQQKKKFSSLQTSCTNKQSNEIRSEADLESVTTECKSPDQPANENVVESNFDAGDSPRYDTKSILESTGTPPSFLCTQKQAPQPPRRSDGQIGVKCVSDSSLHGSSQCIHTTKRVCFDPHVITIESSNGAVVEEDLLCELEKMEIGLECENADDDENADVDNTSFAGSDLWEMETLTSDQLAVMLHLRDGIKIKDTEKETKIDLDIDVGLCELFSRKDNSDSTCEEPAVDSVSKSPMNIQVNEDITSKNLKPYSKTNLMKKPNEAIKNESIADQQCTQREISKGESYDVFPSPFKFPRYRYIDKNYSESTEGSDSGETLDDEDKFQEGGTKNVVDSTPTRENVACKRKLHEPPQLDRQQDFCSESSEMEVTNCESQGSSISDDLQQRAIDEEPSSKKLPRLYHSSTKANYYEMYPVESLVARGCFSDEHNINQPDVYYISPRSRSATEMLKPTNNSSITQEFVFYDKIAENTETLPGYHSSVYGKFVEPRTSLAEAELARCGLPKHASSGEVNTDGIQLCTVEANYENPSNGISERSADGLGCNRNASKSDIESSEAVTTRFCKNATHMGSDGPSLTACQPMSNENGCNPNKRGRHFMSQGEFIQKRQMRDQNEFPWSTENITDLKGCHIYQIGTMHEEDASTDSSEYSLLSDIGHYEMIPSDQEFVMKQMYIDDKSGGYWGERSESSPNPTNSNVKVPINGHLSNVSEEPDEFLDEPGYDWKEDFMKWKSSRRQSGESLEKLSKRSGSSGRFKNCEAQEASQSDETDEGKSPGISLSCSVPKPVDQKPGRKSLAKHTSKRSNCRFYVLQKTRSENWESDNENSLDGRVFILEGKHGDFIVPNNVETVQVDASSSTCEVSAIELLMHDEKFRKVKMIWAVGTFVFLIFFMLILQIDKLFPDQVSGSEQKYYTFEQVLLDYVDL